MSTTIDKLKDDLAKLGLLEETQKSRKIQSDLKKINTIIDGLEKNGSLPANQTPLDVKIVLENSGATQKINQLVDDAVKEIASKKTSHTRPGPEMAEIFVTFGQIIKSIQIEKIQHEMGKGEATQEQLNKMRANYEQSRAKTEAYRNKADTAQATVTPPPPPIPPRSTAAKEKLQKIKAAAERRAHQMTDLATAPPPPKANADTSKRADEVLANESAAREAQQQWKMKPVAERESIQNDRASLMQQSVANAAKSFNINALNPLVDSLNQYKGRQHLDMKRQLSGLIEVLRDQPPHVMREQLIRVLTQQLNEIKENKKGMQKLVRGDYSNIAEKALQSLQKHKVTYEAVTPMQEAKKTTNPVEPTTPSAPLVAPPSLSTPALTKPQEPAKITEEGTNSPRMRR